MSTAEVTGLFGLGGVALGGAMAMLSARWQAAPSSKGRIAELEVQLRNEGVLRDEASRRTAILELLAILERLASAVVTVTMTHGGHGQIERDGGQMCELRAMPDVITAGTEFYAAHQDRIALLDDNFRYDRVIEIWEYLYLFTGQPMPEMYYETYSTSRDEYCAVGAKVACLEMPIRDAINQLKAELKAELKAVLAK
jgi:hypothetical protein